jgi:hypothetical protein
VSSAIHPHGEALSDLSHRKTLPSDDKLHNWRTYSCSASVFTQLHSLHTSFLVFRKPVVKYVFSFSGYYLIIVSLSTILNLYASYLKHSCKLDIYRSLLFVIIEKALTKFVLMTKEWRASWNTAVPCMNHVISGFLTYALVKNTTPWLLVRKRIIPVEQPPLVDEI